MRKTHWRTSHKLGSDTKSHWVWRHEREKHQVLSSSPWAFWFVSLCFYAGYPQTHSITVSKLNNYQWDELFICNKITCTAKDVLEKITNLSARFWSPRLYLSFLQRLMEKPKTPFGQPHILLLCDFFRNCDCFRPPFLTIQKSSVLVPLEISGFMHIF